MFLRLAAIEEADACYQCIEDARAYHKSLGFVQWSPDYPAKTTIIDDIEAHRGYVFCDEDGLLMR